MRNPLIQAAENSIQELVEKILEKFPEAAYTIDRNGKNIFHIAVEQKDEKMYEFLKRNVRRDGMVEALDNDGNTILHLATKKGNSPRVHLGHLNQMAWDAYWLKRIWYDSPTHFLYLQNTAGKTPNEIFEENHSDLRVKAEKALKDMNNGLMLFSALIGTVNYAAIFTIPGGIDQDRKSTNFSHPTLYHSNHETDLLLFLWYTGGGLFSSFVALVTMVAIQLSRFCSNDFYMALPIRYVVALTAIFVSTVFTTNACFKAYDIMDIKFNVDVLYGTGIFRVEPCLLRHHIPDSELHNSLENVINFLAELTNIGHSHCALTEGKCTRQLNQKECQCYFINWREGR
ncbi:hypothetical protein Acr_03g0014890 [Actinidia rufa]|uniref:PGG domain-containing protein n=1 Tax=Actinidia rufa TaxID=165716 RepID=A0A7J0EE36_9ERIC|nr:hypothetical protein Acr_03g0014890 [Actinidia rufa]